MAEICDGEQTAAVFKVVRVRDGLSEWCEAVRRQVRARELPRPAAHFLQADTTLTEDESVRGVGRLRRAVRRAEETANPEPEATGVASWFCADGSQARRLQPGAVAAGVDPLPSCENLSETGASLGSVVPAS
jgi:hypothetical protein